MIHEVIFLIAGSATVGHPASLLMGAQDLCFSGDGRGRRDVASRGCQKLATYRPGGHPFSTSSSHCIRVHQSCGVAEGGTHGVLEANRVRPNLLGIASHLNEAAWTAWTACSFLARSFVLAATCFVSAVAEHLAVEQAAAPGQHGQAGTNRSRDS